MEEDKSEEKAPKVIDRRRLLTLTAATAAGLVVTLLPRKVRAATGEYLIIGQHNWANDGDITELRAKVDSADWETIKEKGLPSAFRWITIKEKNLRPLMGTIPLLLYWACVRKAWVYLDFQRFMKVYMDDQILALV